MRIVSGKYKGRRINAPKNLPVRPTTDFAKEGLFNVLRTRVELEDLKILDLFAGSGNISLEFASRGAQSIVSVDQDRNCVNFIRKISADLDIKEILPIRSDVLKYLEKNQSMVDLVFADPPYAFEKYDELIRLVLEGEKLSKEDYFILEHGKEQDFSEHKHFQFSKKFGNVNFTFFTKS